MAAERDHDATDRMMERGHAMQPRSDPFARIERIDPSGAAAGRLIGLSDAYLASLYPAESNHLESVQALRATGVLFVGAFVEGELVACGAVKICEDDGHYGEIKRVYVEERHRGAGLSKQIMTVLEAHLLHSGIKLARLETGIRQPEALGLYRRLGYQVRGPFGAYAEDPLSVFMEKVLHEG